MQLPPKLEDAVLKVDGLIDFIRENHVCLVNSEMLAAWNKIKFDLRRLQEIDKRHEGSW